MAYVAQLSPEIVKSYKSMAKLCLEQAKTCLSVGGPFKENALMVLKEIDKYDPDNEEYQALLKSISE